MRLPHAKDLPLPKYYSAGASGMDLHAAVDPGGVTLLAGQRMLVPTGLVLELPSTLEAQVRPRSGLAIRHGITVVNSPGTIDSDYRGEIKVPLINLDAMPYRINRGDRIAQLVFQLVERVVLEEVERVEDTDRGSGGFGSTG